METVQYNFADSGVCVDTEDLNQWPEFKTVCRLAAKVLNDDHYNDPAEVIHDAIDNTRVSPEVVYYFGCIAASLVLDRSIKDISAAIRQATEALHNDK